MLLAIFLVCALLQLMVWAGIYAHSLTPTASRDRAPHTQPVSVIVCFRNERPNLEACLRGILTQAHPHFEVLAVDDHSTDGSEVIVRRLQLDYPNLHLIDPGPTRPGKKDALTAGIRAARHDLLLLIDADCVPASADWLARMTAPLVAGDELVLGCAPYHRAPGLLNLWQRYEATHTVLQYQGLARLGLPYMGVGRNLAYHRYFFERAGGFAAHGDLPGGDDDLLVSHHAKTVARVTDPAAWTYSASLPSWRAYVLQKRRHQSAGRRYPPVVAWLLTVLAASHGLFYLLGCMLLFTPFWSGAMLAYGLRAVLVWCVFREPSVWHFLGACAGAMKMLIGDALWSIYLLGLAVATALPPGRW